jgi:hypothetical protein
MLHPPTGVLMKHARTHAHTYTCFASKDAATSLANVLRSTARMRNMSLGTPAASAWWPKALSLAALTSNAVRKPCKEEQGSFSLTRDLQVLVASNEVGNKLLM